MSTIKIENFFAGKTLVIPSYQRNYAWIELNVNDLFNDIEEAIEIGGGHYLGTFILSQQDKGISLYTTSGSLCKLPIFLRRWRHGLGWGGAEGS